MLQLISYKRYLECKLFKWRLSNIYLSLNAQVAVGTFLMKSPVFKLDEQLSLYSVQSMYICTLPKSNALINRISVGVYGTDCMLCWSKCCLLLLLVLVVHLGPVAPHTLQGGVKICKTISRILDKNRDLKSVILNIWPLLVLYVLIFLAISLIHLS